MSESLLSWPGCFCHQQSVKLLTSRVNRAMITEKDILAASGPGGTETIKQAKPAVHVMTREANDLGFLHSLLNNQYINIEYISFLVSCLSCLPRADTPIAFCLSMGLETLPL